MLVFARRVAPVQVASLLGHGYTSAVTERFRAVSDGWVSTVGMGDADVADRIDVPVIDIALDPFPHNAGTTTVEALWQGVPVVTLRDRPGVGRVRVSLLRAVGLDDFVAEGEPDYVERAIRAAGDLAAPPRRFAMRPASRGRWRQFVARLVRQRLTGASAAGPGHR